MWKKVFLGVMLLCFGLSMAACGDLQARDNLRLTFGADKSKLQALVQQADTLSASYFYDEAIQVLSSSVFADTDELKQKIEQINQKKTAIVEYKGPVYHVFFHSLIVYPELAFDGDNRAEGYDMWMTTVSEFKAMLPQMRERGFILYPLDQIRENQPIYLPEGKKPLIISIDDVNYYEYMKTDGFATRLVLTDAGEVLTEVVTPQGETIITNDGDVMPILDQFVKENPDFSYHGAKGVVASTGYQGALGYRITDLTGAELEQAQKQVLAVVQAMKKNGWLFANHSYTHNEYFKDGNVKLDVLQNDTKRWQDTIAPYLENPSIYITPFGYHLNPDDPIHRSKFYDP